MNFSEFLNLCRKYIYLFIYLKKRFYFKECNCSIGARDSEGGYGMRLRVVYIEFLLRDLSSIKEIILLIPFEVAHI